MDDVAGSRVVLQDKTANQPSHASGASNSAVEHTDDVTRACALPLTDGLIFMFPTAVREREREGKYSPSVLDNNLSDSVPDLINTQRESGARTTEIPPEREPEESHPSEGAQDFKSVESKGKCR